MSIDANNLANQRKRSSLKQANFFCPVNDPKDFPEWLLRQKNKSLKWDAILEEQGSTQGQPESTSDTPAVISITVSGNLPVTNKEAEETQATNTITESEVQIIESPVTKDTNFEEQRRQSIKDEFLIAKELLKKCQDELVESDMIGETMKNTIYNQSVDLQKEDEDEDSDENKDY